MPTFVWLSGLCRVFYSSARGFLRLMNQNLSSYYNDRAKEYDRVYQIPEEQADLLQAASLFQNLFSQRSVLEIACGTGYWTEQIAQSAASILATDINASMIEIARTRPYATGVAFQVADMYALRPDSPFDGVFGGFIWSHILLQDLDGFLDHLKTLMPKGGVAAFIDSKPVQGTNHDLKRIARVDEHGNTFQMRRLDNGVTYEVLKNFPEAAFLFDKLSQMGTEVEVTQLEHYWIATCTM
jgi:ubiquinone/menaquinone biosynthesis C-methylase UbiE